MSRIFLILILFVSTSFAGSWRRSAAVPAAAGVTFFINEDFEGTGTPAGWFNSGGNFDSTTSPLAGAQSYRLPDGSNGESSTFAQGNFYTKFRVRFSALPASFSQFFRIRNSAFQIVLEVTINSSGTVTVTDGDFAQIFATTTATMSAATSYDVEIQIAKGTGSNGICSVGFVAAGGSIPTTGTAFASGSNSTNTTDSEALVFRGSGGIPNTDFDNVQSSLTFIP